MKVNDVITIVNKVGLLEVRLLEEIDLKTAGITGLGAFTNCRLEYHKGHYGEIVISLYDHNDTDNLEIFIVCFDTYGDVSIFKAEILGTEKSDNVYTTTYSNV